MDISDDAREMSKQVICPYCGSADTELFALFGQRLLTVQYYCNTCHTPFEHIKDEDVLGDQGVTHIATRNIS
jgi:DNA-directed RNA polymerase subunit RPC12/RpoP